MNFFRTLGVLVSTMMIFSSSHANSGIDHWPNGIIPEGDRVIRDDRSWSCQELTEDERQLVGTKKLSFLSGTGGTKDQSCLVKDTEGNPSFLRQRYVLPGSELLTHNDTTGESTLQTWNSQLDGITTISDGEGSSIELPIVKHTYLQKSWKNDAERVQK